MSAVALSLGSNIGDKAARIREAVERLVKSGAVKDAAVSSMYRTAPWGDADQDWFVNACIAGETDIAPLELLAVCKGIEQDMGRAHVRRWGPRIIDIDILYVGDAALDTPELKLPHTEIFSRAFVLIPLAEIRPGLVIGGHDVSAAAAAIGSAGVTKM